MKLLYYFGLKVDDICNIILHYKTIYFKHYLSIVSSFFISPKINNRTSHDHQILFEVARTTRIKHFFSCLDDLHDGLSRGACMQQTCILVKLTPSLTPRAPSTISVSLPPSPSFSCSLSLSLSLPLDLSFSSSLPLSLSLLYFCLRLPILKDKYN